MFEATYAVSPFYILIVFMSFVLFAVTIHYMDKLRVLQRAVIDEQQRLLDESMKVVHDLHALMVQMAGNEITGDAALAKLEKLRDEISV